MKGIAVGWCSVYDSMNESFGEGCVSDKPRIYLPPCNHCNVAGLCRDSGA